MNTMTFQSAPYLIHSDADLRKQHLHHRVTPKTTSLGSLFLCALALQAIFVLAAVIHFDAYSDEPTASQASKPVTSFVFP